MITFVDTFLVVPTGLQYFTAAIFVTAADYTITTYHIRRLIDAVTPLYKVVAVRNPLTKLMSGFRDKVLRYV